MSEQLEIQFDATSIAPQRRLRRWQEWVGDHLSDVDMRALSESSSLNSYGGAMAVRSTQDLTIAGVCSANHRLIRTPERVRRSGRETGLVNIMLQGECHLEQNGRRTILRPGDLCIYESVRPYEIVAQGPFQVQVLLVERQKLESAIGNLRQLSAMRISANAAAAEIARQFWLDFARKSPQLAKDDLTSLTCAGLDLLRIATGSCLPSSADGSAMNLATMYRARCYMRNNLSNSAVTPTHIARACGLSLRRLQELFQEQDTTMMAELRNLRLAAARDRLRDPRFRGLSIQRIMESAGLLNQAQFSRAFKRAYGMSPRVWRLGGTV